MIERFVKTKKRQKMKVVEIIEILKQKEINQLSINTKL